MRNVTYEGYPEAIVAIEDLEQRLTELRRQSADQLQIKRLGEDLSRKRFEQILNKL